MFQNRQINKEINSINSLGGSNPEFLKLKEIMMANYPITEVTLNEMEKKISFDMGYNEITAQKILDEIEAKIVTENLKNENLDENIVKTFIIESLHRLIEVKGKKARNHHIKNNVMTKTNNIKSEENMIKPDRNSNYKDKELKFDVFTTFNEKSHLNPSILNSTEISYTFFSNLEIKEYSIIPKDEEVYFEEYINYFKMFKKDFLESLMVEPDNNLLDIDKFVLLVNFDNYEGRPLLSDLVLIDPLKNFKKYHLRIENETFLKDFYLFNGQIIYVEGHLKNNEIFASHIIYGFNLSQYVIKEPYVKGFFIEASPYLIYAMNGPIFSKNNIDLTLFLKTLTTLSNDNPHALIIMGPLLNTDNLILNSGDIRISDGDEESSLNYFEFFDFILSKISEIFLNKRTTVIMCPSLNDITNFYPLPQPPYNQNYLKSLNTYDLVRRTKLKLLGNPQIFQLNEMIIGIANFDVVKDMISYSIRSENKIPLESSLEMLIQQRSFYPILPNLCNCEEIDKIDKVITIDERKLQNLYMNAVPDIIITTVSTMQPFVKKTTSTLFINTGNLFTKQGEPGSLTKIISYPPNNTTGIDVVNRLKVDILKLKI